VTVKTNTVKWKTLVIASEVQLGAKGTISFLVNREGKQVSNVKKIPGWN
jgi:hypothetical protein